MIWTFLFFCIVTIGFDELDQLLNSLIFGNVFFYAFFLFIEADFSTTGTYIAIVGIRHFAGTIDNTAHNADLQTFQVRGSCFDTGDGRLQII